MRSLSHLLALSVLLTACAPPAARLAGRVVHDGDPVPGAVVTLRGVAEGGEFQAVADPQGVYRFPPLAPGAYRLTGSTGNQDPLGLIAGKNPVQLAAGSGAWIGLQAVPRETPRFAPASRQLSGFGDLSGRILHRGQPVQGATLYLYLDDALDLKGPGFRQSFPSPVDGTYFLSEIPEGSYFLVARKRRTGTVSGPVREGDLHGPALANPIPIRAGEETLLDVHVVRKERDDDPNLDLLARTGTGIRGRVVDADGHPRAGVYVFAYRNRVIGHGMPDFLTLPTGAEGDFALSLGAGGLFYVGARERSGGSPVPGEFFGFYEGSADHAIEVAKGRIVDGVEIVVRRVLEP